jgi:cytochrome c oxidase cbb3-type subunit I/II
LNHSQSPGSKEPTSYGRAIGVELPRIDYDLIRCHGHAALITVLISALFGILVATKFNFPTFLGGHAWETWGRLRYNHTQGIFFGWLGNAFLAFLYFVIPRLTNRPVTSRSLGWGIFWIWNFVVVLPGWILVCMGFSQPLEWAEFPIIVDVFVILAFLLMLVQFVLPLLRVPAGDLYVSGWYITGGLVFTTLAYPIGNLVPEFAAGAKGAAFSGLWIHDAVGLFVTPLALSIAYYVIPSVTHRPIFSHFISMMGFWLLFFIYPLNGTHHFVFSAIPMSAQRGAIIASIYLGLSVILVVTNLLLSLRGSSDKVGSNVPLRFVWFGVVAYLLVSLQGSVQALMPVNRFIHFSDWVIGHSHLAMIGFASFTAAGGLAHVWSSLPGARYSARAMNWAYWLLALGLSLMVIDLTAAGLVEGQLWVSPAPWIDSVRAMYPYWLTRTISGLPILAGFLMFWIGLLTGPKHAMPSTLLDARTEPKPYAGEQGHATEEIFHGTPSILGYAFVIAFVAGFGFFVLSFVVLGILPARQLQAEIDRTAPRSMQPLTASEAHGRMVYGREGCAYCHTEQVRVISADVVRFGAPTAPWETQYDYPHLWGTRRIGPDLSREHGLRTDDWHFAHLFDPRSTVPDSIMPPYPWLFNGTSARPNRDGLDLVAYLRSLGRERELAGDSGNEQVDRGMAMEMSSGYSAHGIPDTRPRIDVGGINPDAPIFTGTGAFETAKVAYGRDIFQHNCTGCHGDNADGKGKARAGLLPVPVDLHQDHYSDAHLATILWDGVYGSAMPPWRQLDKSDLTALTAYVRSLEAQVTPVSMSSQDLDVAANLFAANCVSCHGEHGAGDGPAAGGIKPSPVNFHVRQPSPERAWTVLERGIPGSSMPAWKNRLSEEDRHLLVRYVQSLYDGGRKEEQAQ